jgi:alkylation response protein AidB-like acyl-CoA dehydrogenase
MPMSLPCTKIFTIFEGTSEIQRMLIGRAVTGLDVR